MITLPYKDIDPRVEEVLETLVFEENPYNMGHARRYARTLEILMEQKISGKFLELGTSSVIPLALDKLIPGLDITVTDFHNGDLVGEITASLGEQTKTMPCYSLDLESTPLPADDKTFDVVLCSEVLEHMDVDPMYMMSEINRVLKDGGLLVLTTPNCNSTHALWKMLRGIDPYFYMQYHTDRNPYRHNYEYGVRSLQPLLIAAGFNGELWTENSFEEPVLEDLARLAEAGYNVDLSLMGDNLFAVVKKVSGVVERYPAPVYVEV